MTRSVFRDIAIVSADARRNHSSPISFWCLSKTGKRVGLKVIECTCINNNGQRVPLQKNKTNTFILPAQHRSKIVIDTLEFDVDGDLDDNEFYAQLGEVQQSFAEFGLIPLGRIPSRIGPLNKQTVVELQSNDCAQALLASGSLEALMACTSAVYTLLAEMDGMTVKDKRRLLQPALVSQPNLDE
eukprot:TRINITY_DN10403_c0_g1_i2.p2 TRINITY_DN10403_c0_g1~~TRINITY_DN10403_c0_g1_i2.p2  ORF type:complete len:185 (+),score=31.44 TRINITY_DN10403_c0_g1_i2:141-695(+)